MHKAWVVPVVGFAALCLGPAVARAVVVNLVDPGGTPITETEITLDGQPTKTDDRGRVDIPPGPHTVGGGALTKRVDVPPTGGNVQVQRFTALSGQFPPGFGSVAFTLAGEFGTSPRFRLVRDRQTTEINGFSFSDTSTQQQIEEFNNDNELKTDSNGGTVRATIGLGTFPIFPGVLVSLAGDVGIGGSNKRFKQRSRSDSSTDVTIDVAAVDYLAGLKALLQFFPDGWSFHPFVEGGLQFRGANGSGDRSVSDLVAGGLDNPRSREAKYYEQDYSAWLGVGASFWGDRIAPYALGQYRESHVTTRTVNDFTFAGFAGTTRASAEYDISPAHRWQFGGGVKVIPITAFPLIFNVQALTDGGTVEVTANASWVFNFFGR